VLRFLKEYVVVAHRAKWCRDTPCYTYRLVRLYRLLGGGPQPLVSRRRSKAPPRYP
jgi:hypothetical protein